MHNTDEAVEAAGDDIARNGPFPRKQAAALRADDELYRELGEVARRRVEEQRSLPAIGTGYGGEQPYRGAEHYWGFRAAIAVAVLTFVALITLGVLAARSQEASTACPPPAKSCKILVLTPEEEQALMQPRGVLDTAREARPLDLGQIVPYFREKITRAPAGTVPPEAVPVPRPRPPEAPQDSKP